MVGMRGLEKGSHVKYRKYVPQKNFVSKVPQHVAIFVAQNRGSGAQNQNGTFWLKIKKLKILGKKIIV